MQFIFEDIFTKMNSLKKTPETLSLQKQNLKMKGCQNKHVDRNGSDYIPEPSMLTWLCHIYWPKEETALLYFFFYFFFIRKCTKIGSLAQLEYKKTTFLSVYNILLIIYGINQWSSSDLNITNFKAALYPSCFHFRCLESLLLTLLDLEVTGATISMG